MYSLHSPHYYLYRAGNTKNCFDEICKDFRNTEFLGATKIWGLWRNRPLTFIVFEGLNQTSEALS